MKKQINCKKSTAKILEEVFEIYIIIWGRFLGQFEFNRFRVTGIKCLFPFKSRRVYFVNVANLF